LEKPRRDFEILDATPLHRGFFSLSRLRLRHTLFGGGWSENLHRELFHRGSCVAVVPYDPVADKVVLIEQFRVGAVGIKDDPWLLEIVAGAIEEGETPEHVAHRETREEAGCDIDELILVGEFFTTPGGCSERISLYCGIVDASDVGGVFGVADEHEDIRASAVDLDLALEWVKEGRIDSAIPIVALQWLALNRQRFTAANAG
jgi:ADP-ribose pyrophosphatase